MFYFIESLGGILFVKNSSDYCAGCLIDLLKSFKASPTII